MNLSLGKMRKKLQMVPKRQMRKISLLWKKNKYFRYSVIVLAPIFVGIIFGSIVFLLDLTKTEQGTSDHSKVEDEIPGAIGNEVTPVINDITAKNLLASTNSERKRAKLSKLTLSDILNKSAKAKCDHMLKENYWAHTSPSGVDPWFFFEKMGYTYIDAGENLAYRFATADGVVKGWMNSPSHRKNLLDKDFTEVGFGVCKGGNFQGAPNTVVVQHLALPGSAQPQQYTPAPYQAPACKKIPIPYKTVYEDASYLYVGETDEYGGHDGYRQTCTADSNGYKPRDFTIPPIDKTVLVGTKPLPPEELEEP